MEPNENALKFASTWNDLDGSLPKGRGACFDFGQWYGCRTDCPVFQEGNCKIEDVNAFAKMIKEDKDLSDEDVSEIIKMYPVLEEFLK